MKTRRDTIICLLLVAACLMVFGRVMGFEFLNFDDNAIVSENPHVNAGFTRDGVVWALTEIDYFYWQPVTWFSHMLDCQLFGLRAGWHHAVSLLLHIANSVLVFLLFRRLTGAFWRSAVLAAVFAVHPLRIESVVWIAERKDVLSAFWFFVTVWAYVRYVDRPKARRYYLVLAVLAIGLMSKPMLMTAPFLLLLLDYWPLRRSAPAEKLPMFALSAVSLGITYIGTSRLAAINTGASIPLAQRVANALVSYVSYVELAFWPHDLAILYPYRHSIAPWKAVAAACLLAAITGSALWLGRRRRYLAVGWLWFVIGLVPAIGLVQVGRQAMADRFTYIPLIGLGIAVVWGCADLLGQHWRLAAALAAAVVVACGVASWRHVGVWHDSVTVFTDDLRVTQDNASPQHFLAMALEARGRFDEALPHHAEAVRIEPSYFLAQYDYGLALERRGDTADAAAHFAQAVRYFPTYHVAHYHLGLALARLSQPGDAAKEWRRALETGLSGEEAVDARRRLGCPPAACP
ncbi:MAG TPA: tetratricopeptide repeat protein [Bryobacteraceae bacterium]|nr:tetratricopeptide repeat protein [Bryobacteraceae bacterium]